MLSFDSDCHEPSGVLVGVGEREVELRPVVDSDLALADSCVNDWVWAGRVHGMKRLVIHPRKRRNNDTNSDERITSQTSSSSLLFFRLPMSAEDNKLSPRACGMVNGATWNVGVANQAQSLQTVHPYANPIIGMLKRERSMFFIVVLSLSEFHRTGTWKSGPSHRI